MDALDRRIAAIMVADIVESTAAMASNEEDAVARFIGWLNIVQDRVAEHGGRVFNAAGDALFAEFPSAINALHAAMDAEDES